MFNAIITLRPRLTSGKLMWLNFEQNQSKTMYFWRLFQQSETACQSELSRKVYPASKRLWTTCTIGQWWIWNRWVLLWSSAFFDLENFFCLIRQFLLYIRGQTGEVEKYYKADFIVNSNWKKHWHCFVTFNSVKLLLKANYCMKSYKTTWCDLTGEPD